MTTTRRTLLAGSAVATAGALLGVPAARAHARPEGRSKPTVVLVHGAFADASGWNAATGNANVLPAAAQRFMAKRAGARTTEVNASHVVMISQPVVTADLIKRAAYSFL